MEIAIRCKYDEMVPLETLDSLKHPKNPNFHPKDQIERLAKILKYQGIRHTIVVSNLTGRITKGHGRLAAAHELALETFPVEYQDYENEDQEYADIIADNSIASWAELSLEMINSQIPDLGPDLNIELLGIKNFEIEPADKKQKKQKPCPHCGKMI